MSAAGEDKTLLGENETTDLEKDDIRVPTKRKRKCAHCGKVIEIGENVIRHKGKAYCESCYNSYVVTTEVQLAEKQQRDKELFWEYVKVVYHIEEIPERWVIQVDRMLKEDSHKNWSSLRFTLWYVKNVMCMPTNPDYGLYFLKDHYSAAATYYAATKEVVAKNMVADMSGQTIQKVKVSSPRNERLKPRVNMEDL